MSLLTLLKDKLFGGGTPVLPQILPVAAPINPDGVLGCGDARAEIWTRGLGARVVDLPNINEAAWTRVLSDTSDGSVTLDGYALSADPSCCRALRAVRPWKHELVIYRDGSLEWSGPITQMSFDPNGSVIIAARDLSAWLDHRFVHTTHIYGGQGANQGSTDTTVIFTDLVTDAMLPDTSPALALDIGIVAGVLAQGNYTPASFKTVGPLIRDLAKGSIDWYVINRTLSYTGGGASASPVVPGAQDVTAASIANPSFEVNTAGWTATNPNPWSFARTTAQFHSGVASGIASYTPVTPPYFSTQRLTTSVTNLIVGKSYTLAGWVRGNGVAPSISTGYRLTFSIAGVTSADYGYQMTAATPATWIQVSVTFIATAASHTLTIDGGYYDPPNWYIDDLTLMLNNPDAPPPIPTPSTTTGIAIRITDDDLQQPAKITLSGLNQETRSVVASQQSGGDVAFYGEAPAPNWALNTTGPGLTTDQQEFGLLETPTTSTLADASSAQSQATQRNLLLSGTPAILDSFVLSRSAGVSIDDLIPGTLIAVQLDRPCISVQQVMLLRQVSVKAAPGGEQVTLTLEPAVQV